MKKLLQLILRFFAQAVLKKYKPQIIGITGSVGKTSAKEAITFALAKNFRVRANIKNYNNEIGLPLTILGRPSPKKNLFIWLKLFLFAIRLLLWKHKKYPQVLVLEMGVDRPGDIKYLTDIARPNIAILTTIASSHLEFFGSIDKIAQEKRSIFNSLAKQDWVVLNHDDERVMMDADKLNAQKITFGFSPSADIYIHEVKIVKHFTYGTCFTLTYQNKDYSFILNNVLGKQHAQAVAIGFAVAIILKLEPAEIIPALETYKSARGRTNLLPGIKKSWVFDDLLELGASSEEAHRDLGKQIASSNIDYLFLIGERARDIKRGAQAAGMSEDKIFSFAHTIEAGYFLQDRIKEADIILVKGSRGAKMEQVVYEIMAKPWEAGDLLVGPIV